MVVKENRYPSTKYISSYLRYVFANAQLRNSRMLDIGGGSGVFSFYAACQGAKEVVCLEPSAAGSSQGVTGTFKHWASELQVESVQLRSETLDDYDACGSTFDIVLLHHAVNHLDEEACMNLQHDASAREVFSRIFQRLAKLCGTSGVLILSDCSSRNVAPFLGRHNRFVPSIEWEKHQPPRIWCHMLKEAGFRKARTRWDRFAGFPVGPVGAFFLTSHFCITAWR